MNEPARDQAPFLDTDSLYQLLPAVHRHRDAEQGYPLRALIALLAREGMVVERDIFRLHENAFIETCDPWVVAYIGDLLGIEPLADTGRSARAEVANTLGYRRRKGTLGVVEDLARTVTGWPARAVEGFQHLATTQHTRHRRLHALRAPDLRQHSEGGQAHRQPLYLEQLGGAPYGGSPHGSLFAAGPFDPTLRTLDVRRADPRRHGGPEGGPHPRYRAAWHGLPHVAVHLWRLLPYPLRRVVPARVDDNPDQILPGQNPRYTFSTLGQDVPLWRLPQPEGSYFGLPGASVGDGAAISSLAGELHVPSPIRRRHLHAQFEGHVPAVAGEPADYGPARSLEVEVDGAVVPAATLMVCDLSGWTHRPPAGRIAVDPRLGRLAFADGEAPGDIFVSWHHAAPADLGAGGYDRTESFTTIEGETVLGVGAGEAFADIEAALVHWGNLLDAEGSRPSVVIEIRDSASYRQTLVIDVPANRRVELRAADRQRPTVHLAATLQVSGGEGSAFELNGLLLTTSAVRTAGQLNQLRIVHCTLVPGRSVAADGTPDDPGAASLEITSATTEARLERSILGPLRVAPEAQAELVDCIVDAAPLEPWPAGGSENPPIGTPLGSVYGGPGAPAADNYGGALTAVSCTFLGSILARQLTLGDSCLFLAPVHAERRQQGCVRYSYVAPGSRVPRRYRCQPDVPEEIAPAQARRLRDRVRPRLLSARYGTPHYARLHPACPQEIFRGAADQAEMGVFQHLRQPQRLDNLRRRLSEYLPVGRQAGIFFST